ncbi:hypothetical protein IT400_00955, partial [Candidatus Nomurabacteria bacterium]|nr:hypothetical protein [Candidatus Nomurabacteria bacterium]
YAMDYDFTKPFFTQYRELVQKVPHMAIVNDDGIASLNCEYTHDWWFSKNCYMCFSGWRNENVLYSFFIMGAKNLIDCLDIVDLNEWIYECISCSKSYQTKYSQFCVACIDSQFLYDCRNCNDCFMCAGLRNKKYCFKNAQYSKEEYEKILEDYRLDTFSGVERAQKEYDKFILQTPRRYAYIIQSLNCTGNVLDNCKNTKYSYNLDGAENCRYYDFGSKPKDSYDTTMSGELSQCYESIVVDHSDLCIAGVFSVKSQDIRYTQHCHSSKHLFGCSQIRNGKYCILNKEYTKEEYEELVAKIIAHMNEMPYVDKKGNVYKYGEFYPAELSVFGYNETIAPEQAPLSREDAFAQGYKWQDNLQRTVGKETMKPEEIPDALQDVPDTIVNEVLACINCNRNYKIVPNELIFYKKMNIPIPHRCFHCRHQARIARRNPFKLWKRSCMNEGCTNEFETSYAPERPEIVYCEKCYQAEIN